jgi:ribosome assembly protein YihI (activator of Der GTPase)
MATKEMEARLLNLQQFRAKEAALKRPDQRYIDDLDISIANLKQQLGLTEIVTSA